MSSDPAEAEPLKLKLRVLEAERERLRADMDSLNERLAAIEDEIDSIQTRLSRLTQPGLKRIK